MRRLKTLRRPPIYPNGAQAISPVAPSPPFHCPHAVHPCPSVDSGLGKDGKAEPDPELRDTERVPLAEDVNAFFEREVKPHVPGAWIDESKRDAKDNQVGIVGYEINFNRYFYRYSPPRPLEDIETDIHNIEEDIVRMLREVTASASS